MTKYTLKSGFVQKVNPTSKEVVLEAHLSAVRKQLQSLLDDLSHIHVDELTTFELSFLRRFADNPPTKRYGAELSISMAKDKS